jgi:plasmid stabilization system protein ParE
MTISSGNFAGIWSSRTRPMLAFRFVDAVEASVEQLLRMPHMGAPRELRNPALKGLRVWPVKEFEEFLIFYVVEGGHREGHSHPARQARH